MCIGRVVLFPTRIVTQSHPLTVVNINRPAADWSDLFLSPDCIQSEDTVFAVSECVWEQNNASGSAKRRRHFVARQRREDTHIHTARVFFRIKHIFRLFGRFNTFNEE